MKEIISNRTSIGNTTNPALKVVSLVAAFDIPERQIVIDNKNMQTLPMNPNVKVEDTRSPAPLYDRKRKLTGKLMGEKITEDYRQL